MSAIEPVELSERAAEEIKIIMQSDEIPNHYSLRVGAHESGGGCGSGGSGKLTIGFDEQKEDDIVYTKHGVKIFVNKKHVMYVLGQKVDYKETDDEWGFVFTETKP